MIRLMDMMLLLLLVLAGTVPCQANDGKSPTEGKRIVVIGDSYVRNHKRPWSESWHAQVADRLGMFYLNYGKNGNCIAFDRTRESFGRPMSERYLQMPDSADYIIVIAGHNDAFYLARHTDCDLWPEFTQGLDRLVDGLKEKYPNGKIGFVLPWDLDNPNFREVREQIRKVCGEKGIPVLDISGEGVIKVNDPEFRNEYFQGQEDTAHLNAKGHKLILELGKNFILGL